MTRKTLVVLAIALLVGAAIGFVDSRPTWDDTGVTVGALLLAALVLALIRPRSAWLIGLAVGVPVVVFNVGAHGGFGSLAAVAFSLLGAGIGYGIGRALGVDGARRTA